MKMLKKATPKFLSRLLPRAATSIIVAAAIALPAGAGTAVAMASTGDTSAVAINTKDGSSVFRLTFAVRQVPGTIVDPQNAAVAIASCADCQTVAISIDVVLASGDATTVTPVNEAIAINEDCSSCDTLAAAYQFVYALDTKLKFTADGEQQLAAIRQQLEQLRNSGLTVDQISADVQTLMGQLSDVLNQQLIAVTDPAAGTASGSSTVNAATSGSSPTSTQPTDTTTTPTSTPTDTTTTPTTSTPTDTTTTPTSTPTDTTTTPATTPTDTTSGGTTTTPTSTSPTTTTTTTSPTTTTP